jgi:peptidoglycan/LPS O-acetylase OafA/YrhL
MLGDRGKWLLIYAQNVVVAARGDWAFSSAQINLDHLWSLAVEEHFYLVWPGLVFFSSRRTLLRISIAIVVLAPVLRCVLVRSSIGGIGAFVLTPCRIDSMAIGGLLALAETDRCARAALAKYAGSTGIAALALLVPVLLGSRSFEPMEPLIATLGFSLLAIAAASLLAHLVFNAAVRQRQLRTLGKYSYGLYMLHFPLRAPIAALLQAKRWPLPMHSEVLAWAAYFVLVSIISFGAALVTWTLIEKPALALKKHVEPPCRPACSRAAHRTSSA